MQRRHTGTERQTNINKAWPSAFQWIQRISRSVICEEKCFSTSLHWIEWLPSFTTCSDHVFDTIDYWVILFQICTLLHKRCVSAVLKQTFQFERLNTQSVTVQVLWLTSDQFNNSIYLITFPFPSLYLQFFQLITFKNVWIHPNSLKSHFKCLVIFLAGMMLDNSYGDTEWVSPTTNHLSLSSSPPSSSLVAHWLKHVDRFTYKP